MPKPAKKTISKPRKPTRRPKDVDTPSLYIPRNMTTRASLVQHTLHAFTRESPQTLSCVSNPPELEWVIGIDPAPRHYGVAMVRHQLDVSDPSSRQQWIEVMHAEDFVTDKDTDLVRHLCTFFDQRVKSWLEKTHTVVIEHQPLRIQTRGVSKNPILESATVAYLLALQHTQPARYRYQVVVLSNSRKFDGIRLETAQGTAWKHRTHDDNKRIAVKAVQKIIQGTVWESWLSKLPVSGGGGRMKRDDPCDAVLLALQVLNPSTKNHLLQDIILMQPNSTTLEVDQGLPTEDKKVEVKKAKAASTKRKRTCTKTDATSKCTTGAKRHQKVVAHHRNVNPDWIDLVSDDEIDK